MGRLRITGVVILATVISIGGYVFYSLAFSVTPTNASNGTSNAVITQGAIGPAGTKYACGTPAVQTELYCDQLPAGYVIAPSLPNAPPPFCPTGMTSSACDLLKKTANNGVCDPNETPDTVPLDCGCTGALAFDPFTGRCSGTASVCQLNLVRQAAH